ncbi:MAG: hypothetical protein MJZ02_06970 [Paludibacteraceae bacterium]|nr:hypothetical protein [Paludibacteraceae bacterium]
MKSIMITFDQAHYENIVATLDRLECNGFTYLEQVMGQGTNGGEPHFGSHAWPSMNSAIITMVDDDQVDEVLNELKAIDDYRPQLGLRAFVWNVEKSI